MTNTKACNKCKQVKETTQFKKDKRLKSGYTQPCLDCYNQYASDYREENREQVNESLRSHYANNRLKRIANSQNWAINNPERRAAIELRYRQGHRKETQQRSNDWGMRNPERKRLHKLTRRARVYENGIYLVKGKELDRLYASVCFYCGSTDKIEADHVIPVSRGGRHSIGNLIPACRSCNATKGNRFIIEWKLAQLT